MDTESAAPAVLLRLFDGIAVVTIDRPHARNAIGLGTMAELEAALDQVEASDARVMVIRGEGERAFVSGGDLKELAAIRDEAGAAAMARRMRGLLDRLAALPVPVVAAINGHALGGGAEVAVAADVRIAADDIRIGFTQVKLAIMPAWGGAERLTELVGAARALLLVGTGRTMTAATAERIGLIEEIAPREEFEDRWRALAEEFATLSPEAARSIKQVITAARPRVHKELEADAVRRFARLWIAEDHWQAAERLTAGRG